MTDETNKKLLKLNLSHSIIPRTSMDWNQWFWVTNASDDPNVTVTKHYLRPDNLMIVDECEDCNYSQAINIAYVIGSAFLILLFIIVTIVSCAI